tara:strand:- start:325 stop:951 length:627 start_codon:yes stop_codon:yes gene_type:complete
MYNTFLPINKQRKNNFNLTGGGVVEKNSIVPKPTIEPMKNTEKPITKDILDILKNMDFPIKTPAKDKTRSNVLKKGQTEIEAFVLGKVRAYDKVELVNSVKNIKFPVLFNLLKKLVRTHNPSFKYTSIQINKSVGTNWHRDRGNRGLSYCFALGDYTGGGVVIEFEDGSQKTFDNHNKWLKYDGHSLLHKTASHKGKDRFAIIFYTHY